MKSVDFRILGQNGAQLCELAENANRFYYIVTEQRRSNITTWSVFIYVHLGGSGIGLWTAAISR